MKTATIPADGHWHDLPERPIKSIIAPTSCAEVEIDLETGVGKVRVTRGDDPVKVEYQDGEAHSVKLSDLIPNRRYIGRRDSPVGGATVLFVDRNGDLEKARYLDPRNDLRDHSPDGFQWGYGGSGPSQLALALLADALGDDQRALRHYQTFKMNTVARITGDNWEMSAAGIIAEVESYEKESAHAQA